MNINTIVKQFFVENDFHKLASKMAVVRHDGVIVYSNTENFNESYSIGALVGGLWQAAEALNSLISEQSNIFDFRLSFDTSERGIYVLPFVLNKSTYYICAIYKDTNNPALLKNRLRNLKDTLSFYLDEMVEAPVKTRDGYLFTDITDDEMDKLFNLKRI
tara:strand:- start:446 stop:925 length:480 start_codon:yes stop_codon:yes gene_type:complete